ncbi:MAG: hypothetical protein RBR86_04805 [Pseudobdellovibrionaceae bacterium]|jgi:hypothetical protein|nr:hypothetical protein [Pseudobdellovibrionaceae bacterium]
MSDILRDVDEMMKADRMSQLWQEHGKSVLFAIGLVILGTAFNSGWTSYKDSQAEIQTTAIIDALQNKDQFASLLEASKTLSGTGKGFATMNAASLAIQDGKLEEAAELYSSIQKDSSLPQDMRDLATVQKVSIQLDANKDAKSADLLAELESVLKNKDSVWQLRALMVSALAKAHKDEDYKSALEDLALLSADTRLPPSMKAQVAALQDVYQSKLGKPAKPDAQASSEQKAE